MGRWAARMTIFPILIDEQFGSQEGGGGSHQSDNFSSWCVIPFLGIRRCLEISLKFLTFVDRPKSMKAYEVGPMLYSYKWSYNFYK